MMKIQYLTDSKGKTTGVFIPIEDWLALKDKYQGLEQEEYEIPEWHKAEVRERVLKYEKDGKSLDLDEALKDIENDL